MLVRKKIPTLLLITGALLAYGAFVVFAAPPGPGGYDAGETLDPECNPGDLIPEPCIVKSSSWSLIGNAGTTAGTNFIGTTDAEDLVFKTDDTEVMRILANGNVGIGTDAPGFKLQVDGSFGSQDGDFIILNSSISGMSGSSYNFGGPTNAIAGVLSASNGNYLPYITDATLPTVYQNVQYTGTSGELVTHRFMLATETSRSLWEGAINDNTDTASAGFSYALDTTGSALVNPSVDMHVEKNGVSSSIRVIPTGFIMSPNNVFDLQWTTDEEKKFFIDYANDAIRMGSIDDDKWDTANLGSDSIAIGFADPGSGFGPLAGPIASGQYSIALGTAAQSTGLGSIAVGPGSQALGGGAIAIGFGAIGSGDAAYAFGSGTASGLASVILGSATATGTGSFAIGNNATSSTGDQAFAIGGGSTASAEGAMAFGQGTASGISSFAFGTDNTSVASGTKSFAFGLNTEASGDTSFAFGDGALSSGMRSFAFGPVVSSGLQSFAFGSDSTTASGEDSFAFGRESTASGLESFVMGYGAVSSGSNSFAIGRSVVARAASEITLGIFSSDYTATAPGGYDVTDRLFGIGNGIGAGTLHNAYTLWKDGSFAYNDDNFQNDNAPGTEQNMFYFNFGQHDGLGAMQAKRAIRLGSAFNDEWDINSANVGDRSIAMGFSNSIASGNYSMAFGSSTTASGDYSTAFGDSTVATGNFATAFGNGGLASGNDATSFGSTTTASGISSTSFGTSTIASGVSSTAAGDNTTAQSFAEFAIGFNNTSYVPVSPFDTMPDLTDRLFVIGNGDADPSDSTPLGVWDDNSDAFTILKNGLTGIGYDNFEATALTALLQVNGDIQQTTATSCALSADTDGVIICTPSDENLKTNIENLTYGLDTITALRPVSYEFRDAKFGNGNQIGFLAQELEQIIPEVVTEGPNYKSVNYGLLSSVIVKAIQEMDLKIADIDNMGTSNTWRDSLTAWLGNVSNGITKLFADEIETKTLCVSDDTGSKTCITKDQLDELLQSNDVAPSAPEDVPADDNVTEPGLDVEPSGDPIAPSDDVPTEPSSESPTDPVQDEQPEQDSPSVEPAPEPSSSDTGNSPE